MYAFNTTKTKEALSIDIHFTVTDAYNKEFGTNIQ